jgi:hypothetical protein
LALEKKVLATIVLKNRSSAPIIIRRAKSGLELPLEQLQAVGLKVYKNDGFISVDWESRTLWVDLGSEDS